MKVGTDGVLVGAWINVYQSDKRLLDIGAGTGVIALMLAQRTAEDAMIDAVEIDLDSASQATENILNSPWAQNVEIHTIDIVNFNKSFKYDVIISNPPFFNNSLLCPNKGRSTARHTVSLSFRDLIESVVRLLSPEGRFSIILPTSESNQFEKQCNGYLHLWRRCHVKSRAGGDDKRIMSEYRATPALSVVHEELAIREANSNEYTQGYKDLTADFYLKF